MAGRINADRGAERIREQIVQGVDELLDARGLQRRDVAGIGMGFGGPVDANRGFTMTSHQVGGWDNFPLTQWVDDTLGMQAVLQNDADTAALAEAHYGAGRGFDPVFYVTVGSGIGGGLILGGKIYRGSGRGAAEIGHLRPGHVPQHLPYPGTTVEQIASGFGITERGAGSAGRSRSGRVVRRGSSRKQRRGCVRGTRTNPAGVTTLAFGR